MQILGLLGMYFDAVVVEVEKSLLFFRLALAILWYSPAISRDIHETFVKIKEFSNKNT